MIEGAQNSNPQKAPPRGPKQANLFEAFIQLVTATAPQTAVFALVIGGITFIGSLITGDVPNRRINHIKNELIELRAQTEQLKDNQDLLKAYMGSTSGPHLQVTRFLNPPSKASAPVPIAAMEESNQTTRFNPIAPGTIKLPSFEPPTQKPQNPRKNDNLLTPPYGERAILSSHDLMIRRHRAMNGSLGRKANDNGIQTKRNGVNGHAPRSQLPRA